MVRALHQTNNEILWSYLQQQSLVSFSTNRLSSSLIVSMKFTISLLATIVAVVRRNEDINMWVGL